ncbi:hypothetical protein WICPIJ_001147 [Wickerhamomyces pijperi]|uniref:Uncharacterized protein n=1 Tax=Wickerhamomyces pijperi TaxID=599730 RepID=A0A9P8QEE1_WICPI|nr:hypothetical protein WICPIJ_001147 [Wickerhamomyces pijperi]
MTVDNNNTNSNSNSNSPTCLIEPFKPRYTQQLKVVIYKDIQPDESEEGDKLGNHYGSNQGSQFLKTVRKKFHCFSDMETEREILGKLREVNMGVLSFESMNNVLRLIDKLSVRKTGLKANSVFTANELEYYTWVDGPLSNSVLRGSKFPRVPQYPLPVHLDVSNGATVNNRRYFEHSVNNLISEEEEYLMCFKVYICGECHTGTSYCSDKIQLKEGVWVCGLCQMENVFEENEFYIYNKFEASLPSMMMRDTSLNPTVGGKSDDIMNGSQKEQEQTYSFQDYQMTKEADWSRRVDALRQMPFFSHAETHKQTSFYTGQTPKPSRDNAYCYPTLEIVITCEEFSYRNDKRVYYLFAADFVSQFWIDLNQDSLSGGGTHRFMIVPKTDHVSIELALDQFLAPMNDDLNNLRTRGFNYQQGNVRVTVMNFVAKYDVSLAVCARLKSLANLTNEQSVVIPCFQEIRTRILAYKLVELLYELALEEAQKDIRDLFDRARFNGRPECVHFLVKGSDLGRVTPYGKELLLYPSCLNVLLGAQEILDSYTEPPENMELIMEASEQLLRLANIIDDPQEIATVRLFIEDWGPKVDRFVESYTKLTEIYPQRLTTDCLDVFAQLAKYQCYFGHFTRFRPHFNYSADSIKFDSLRHSNLLAASGKLQVVFFNYMNTLTRIQWANNNN